MNCILETSKLGSEDTLCMHFYSWRKGDSQWKCYIYGKEWWCRLKGNPCAHGTVSRENMIVVQNCIFDFSCYPAITFPSFYPDKLKSTKIPHKVACNRFLYHFQKLKAIKIFCNNWMTKQITVIQIIELFEFEFENAWICLALLTLLSMYLWC